MSADGWRHDRRSMLRAGGAWAVASLFGCRGAEPTAQEPASYASLRPRKSRVVIVRRPDVVRRDGTIDDNVLRSMLDEAVKAVQQAPSASAAWQQLVRPTDIVGIKSNAWQPLATPPALEDALRGAVIAAGVTASDVAVDDRGVRGHPVFTRATALVNVRPMRTHAWSGLGTCLKNYIMFVASPPDYHADACASLGSIWRLPALEGKTRLNVLVMLTPQFHSLGPHSFSRQYTWNYGGLIVGTDVVAVDSVGARIIQAKRRAHFGDDRPISPPPHHIERADTRYALGNSNPTAIDLVRLGRNEDSLI